MKRNFSLIIMSLTVASLFSQSPIKVDFDMSERSLDEVHEPGYEDWVIKNCKDTTRIIDGITFKMAKGADSEGSGLKSHWYKAGIQAPSYARLVSDGLTVNGGDDYAEVDMTISGLSAGTHSLLTFHNTVDSPDDKKYGAIDIYVNNKLVVEGLMQSNRALSTYEAASSYITFEAEAGKPIVISFRSNEDNPGNISWNFMINGFCLDVPNMVKQAKYPSPSDLDFHMDADKGGCTLKWTAAKDVVAHEIYFGTDKDLVNSADKTSSYYKGSQTSTTFDVSELYSMKNYYWRVDEVEADGTVTKGNVWAFAPRQLAFPGAEGYGRFARGGRGGKVVYVTNLSDYDIAKGETPIQGSLRYAVTVETGPRTIIFAVSGILQLKERLTLAQSNVTIAGQTSPGKGICIKGAPFGFSGVTDGIMRFMRIRLGAGRTFDGTGLNGAEHCIFDHNSVSWTIDEAFSSRSGKNFTLQKTMLAEALNVAGHQNYPEGKAHGFAASIGGDIGSFHHNLLAHCAGRNWSLAGGLDGGGAYAGRLDIFNNVVYNWDGRTTDGGAHEVNFVNNYYKKGAATGSDQRYTLIAQLEGAGTGTQSYYYAGNVMTESDGKYLYDGTDNTQGRTYQKSSNQVLDWELWRDQPFFESHAKIESAADAYKSVLSDVGCTMPLFDDHDIRIVNETLTGTYSCTGSKSGKKGLPDSQEDVGGWENYPEIVIDLDEFDTDRDGLPNWWEEMFGLNPNSPADDFSDSNADDDKDGYTNLEEYLNWMATPHKETNSDNAVTFDLAPYTRGYQKDPYYEVVSADDGVSANIEGSILTVIPKAGFGGIAYLDFKVTDAEGSSMTRNVAVKVGQYATNINSDTKEDRIRLSAYPNPVTDKLYIKVSGTDRVNIQLMNVYGGLVMTETMETSVNQANSLDVSTLQAGVYLLKVQQDKYLETIKFIKK